MEEDTSMVDPVDPTSLEYLELRKVMVSRLQEINVMRNALATSTTTKLAFQRLPNHMRRRNMSLHVKRLPRNLREIHANQMKKSGIPPKRRKPSAKYRRRAYNLRRDYRRRQQRCKWLNTHIWHAKRFHMIERWGYKIPNRPCDRAFRACFRATKSHCLLQDISYISCIEIRGNCDQLVKKFQHLTNKSTGFSIAAKAFIRGNREGTITLFQYEENKTPTQAIGSVYYQWEPVKIETEKTRSLWIWIHAAFYNETLESLIKCFEFSINSMETESKQTIPSYINSRGVEMKELRTVLNRFRLTGPLSNAIVQNCFKKYENSSYEVANLENYSPNWQIINSITSPSDLSPHIILSVVIDDPRMNFPKKRTKALPLNENIDYDYYDLPESVASNPLWTEERSIFNSNKTPNVEINKMRHELLVPGSDLPEKAPVPVILVQRPGKRANDHNGYGHGWDLIFPAKWAQPLWLSLIMWGARSGGLRETNSTLFEAGTLETLLPDTIAGSEDEAIVGSKHTDLFFKKPPSKRTNYNKFGIVSPFNCNWRLLIQEWRKEPLEGFSVLRNEPSLKAIQIALNESKSSLSSQFDDNFLIPVKLKLETKGLCKPFAIICLPLEEDYKNVPSELKRDDQFEKRRKEMRQNHQELLKRLRQRRRRAKINGKSVPVDTEMLRNYTVKMRELWLPKSTTIRKSCSREVIGFVKSGGFSFLEGKSTGIGYIVSGALPNLLTLKHKNRVLVRNTDSRQYRLAKLEIICK